MKQTNTFTIDNPTFGYYGRGEEFIKKTREGLTYRMELALQSQPTQKPAWGDNPDPRVLPNKEFRDAEGNVFNAKTEGIKQYVKNEEKKTQSSAPDWEKIGEGRMETLGIDKRNYQTVPPRWFQERGEK